MKTNLGMASLYVALASTLAVPKLVSADTINACVANRIGTIRIVSPTTRCSALESPLSWNSTGPQGPQGPAGITAGIGAAVWGQLRIEKGANGDETCSVPFSRGGTVTAESTGNGAECEVSFTPDDGQSWGTAYICYTSLFSGNATPHSTVCEVSSDLDFNNPVLGNPNLYYPLALFACRNYSTTDLIPTNGILDVGFVCIR